MNDRRNVTMMDITFHPEATKRFGQLAEELRVQVREVSAPQNKPSKDYHLYSPLKFGPHNMSDVKVVYSVEDEDGNQVGRKWQSEERWFGLIDAGYQQAKELAIKFARTSDLHDRV